MRRPFTGLALVVSGLIVLSLIVLGRTERVPQADEGGSRERQILYVTNSAGDDVTLVDAKTHRVIGSIETGTTPHGLVASPDGRRIYITGETDDDVVAIDTATAKVLWKAPVGEQPNEPALSADGRHIYVPIRMSEVTDVVDTTTGKRINSIRTGRVPHNAYPSSDGKWIYVTSRGDEKISIIDPATQQVVGDVPLGGEPRPVAFTKDNTRAYSTLTGLHGFVVADLTQRKVTERIELPKADLPEISVHGYTDTHGIALSRDDKQFWATNVFGNAVTVFSVPDHKVLTSVTVGLAPNWMTFSPDGELLYVSNSGSNDVSVIDVRLFREVVRIPVGMSPKRLLVVTVPEGMGGPDEAGWRTAASRPSITDYWVRGGGILGAETHSFRAKFATGELAAESIPGWYRKLGLPHVAINSRHITSWERDSLDRIKRAIRDEGRFVSAVLIDNALTAGDDAATTARIEEYKRIMRAAHHLGAPVVRITVGAEGARRSDRRCPQAAAADCQGTRPEDRRRRLARIPAGRGGSLAHRQRRRSRCARCGARDRERQRPVDDSRAGLEAGASGVLPAGQGDCLRRTWRGDDDRLRRGSEPVRTKRLRRDHFDRLRWRERSRDRRRQDSRSPREALGRIGEDELSQAADSVRSASPPLTNRARFQRIGSTSTIAFRSPGRHSGRSRLC